MRYRVTARCLGVVLLVAAGLKLHGLAIDPAGRSGIFSAPEWQTGIVEFEFMLALWLLSGSRPLGSWFASILAFVIFAGASFYQGWIGHASCGCFGAIRVNPWITFSHDTGIVAMLLITRPDLRSLREDPRASVIGIVLPVGGVVLGTTLFLGLLAGIAHFGFGSTDSAIAWLRGERIGAYPRLLDLGLCEAGQTRDATVRLIGGTSDCSCIVIDDLPVTIPPGEGRSITVKISPPGAKGLFNRKAFVLTDDRSRRIVFRMTGQISRSNNEQKKSDTKQGS